MKKYKLLKDLPFAKAGEIFKEMLDDDEKVLAPEKWVNFRHSVFVEELYNFNEWFEEFPKTVKYFYINSCGKISEESYDKYDIYKANNYRNRQIIGNSFETYEEAEKRLEWLEAKKVLLEDMKGFKPDWKDSTTEAYEVYFSMNFGKIRITHIGGCHYSEISFRTEEDAKESIKNHEKEWKIYLGVE